MVGYITASIKNVKDTAVGDTVTTVTGQQGEVSSVNVLRQRVKVLINVNDEKELQEYDVKDLKFKPRKKKEKGGDKSGKGEKNAKKGKEKDREREKERGKEKEKNREKKQEDLELEQLEALDQQDGKSRLEDE